MAKYLIVGGVAGGAGTAARLRRRDENAQIIMFERGQYISYANCGLPYYAGNVITERSRLFVMTPERFMESLNVEARVQSEVISINRKAKTIRVRDLKNQSEYDERYDTLILSPGASPVRPPIPGIEHKAIYSLRSVSDIDLIKEKIDSPATKRAVVVGGGFIASGTSWRNGSYQISLSYISPEGDVKNLVLPSSNLSYYWLTSSPVRQGSTLFLPLGWEGVYTLSL